MKTKPDDRAYPVKVNGDYIPFGLTKRELFATMAMQGVINCRGDVEAGKTRKEVRETMAEMAVGYADALITALNDTKETS